MNKSCSCTTEIVIVTAVVIMLGFFESLVSFLE